MTVQPRGEVVYPLLVQIRVLDGSSQIWLKPDPTAAKALRDATALAPGDYVVLMCQVHSVETAGGYDRNECLPANVREAFPKSKDEVSSKYGFTLDLARVFLIGSKGRP